jgi:hypothetical protein
MAAPQNGIMAFQISNPFTSMGGFPIPIGSQRRSSATFPRALPLNVKRALWWLDIADQGLFGRLRFAGDLQQPLLVADSVLLLDFG